MSNLIGERCRPEGDTVHLDQSCGGDSTDRYLPHTRFTRSERPETFVEAVCKNDRLQNLIFFLNQLLLACRGRFGTHVVVKLVKKL